MQAISAAHKPICLVSWQLCSAAPALSCSSAGMLNLTSRRSGSVPAARRLVRVGVPGAVGVPGGWQGLGAVDEEEIQQSNDQQHTVLGRVHCEGCRPSAGQCEWCRWVLQAATKQVATQGLCIDLVPDALCAATDCVQPSLAPHQ